MMTTSINNMCIPKTVLRSRFVTNFACFNLSSNIEPEVIYSSWSGILFSSSTIFVS